MKHGDAFESAAKNSHSADFRKLNPHLCGEKVSSVGTKATTKPRHKRGEMNQTEQRWRDVLSAQQRKGEILDFAYEPFPMRLADDTSYTPDFVSIRPECVLLSFWEKAIRVSPMEISLLTKLFTRPAIGAMMQVSAPMFRALERLSSMTYTDPKASRIVIDEIKGGMIWEKNRIKFKVAREKYPWIEFRLWQWKKGEWTQLL